MANVTLKGNPIHSVGELPKVGSPGPNFRLTRGDLGNVVVPAISRYLPLAQKRFKHCSKLRPLRLPLPPKHELINHGHPQHP